MRSQLSKNISALALQTLCNKSQNFFRRTPLCEKYQNTGFSWSVFSVYGQNRVRIFPYLDRFSNSFQILENANMILSIYGKIRFWGSPYLGIFYALISCAEFFIMVWPESTTLLETSMGNLSPQEKRLITPSRHASLSRHHANSVTVSRIMPWKKGQQHHHAMHHFHTIHTNYFAVSQITSWTNGESRHHPNRWGSLIYSYT